MSKKRSIKSTDDLPAAGEPGDDTPPPIWNPAGHPPADPAAGPEPADDEATELDEMLDAIAAAKDEDTQVMDGRPEWNQ